ncbi:MAG: hypothetical protein GWN58_24030 [Anaerolineae bacterium]|nr:hypothetical protein [Anaerolineae bacterium]
MAVAVGGSAVEGTAVAFLVGGWVADGPGVAGWASIVDVGEGRTVVGGGPDTAAGVLPQATSRASMTTRGQMVRTRDIGSPFARGQLAAGVSIG